MANITVTNNISVIDNIISIKFETDVANITKIELSKDGGNTFINSLNYSNNSASFDITDWENGTYTNCVLRMTFDETVTTHSITKTLSNCTIDNNAISIVDGHGYITTITANSGYDLSTITVTMGGTDITSSAVSGNIINISNVTGDIVITANAIKQQTEEPEKPSEPTTYTITNNLSNCITSNSATNITEGSSYSATITAKAGYDMSSITVTMGGTDITSSTVSGNTITITSVTGNIVINATAIKQQTEEPENPSDLLDSNGAYLLDDFTGTSLNRSKWDYEWGYVRNGELQNYQDTNAVVNNGILELQGRKDSSGTWTSASIISKGHFAFMYGKIECRAKIDPTWGSFSAFWTLGDSFEFGYHNWASPDTLGEYWAWCGEFDVMEFYSGKLTCGTFFNEREESGRVWYNNYDFNAWHTFAMEWLENGTLIFSIDGNELSRTSPTDNRAFHIPHFILINQAIGASGGTPDGSTNAITQYVDWVKYYPPSTNNVVLNSNDFYLSAMDFNDSSHNCMVRPTFNDNCINKSLTWKSSNPSLVTCHGGLCASWAGANGSVTITATSHSGVSKSITLTVNDGILRVQS